MNDLGTISLLVDVRGRPMVTGLANDLNQVAVAEAKVSAATQKVMADLQRTRDIMANLKKATDNTGVAFQRFSAKELQQTSQQLKKFETRLVTTRRGMGQMGMATQQVGYQVGDFLVQVQSGTNFMVAFGQQATQLVGILPAFSKQLGMSVGSLIGISSVLGIAIPLVTAIGAAFMRTSQEVKEGADKQKQAYDAVKESIESLQLARQMASSGAQTESEQTVLNALNTALEERKRLLAEALVLEVENTDEYSLKEAAARGELATRQQANRLAIRQNEELLKELAYQQRLETAAKRRANEKRNEYREAEALRIEEEKALELARHKKDAFHAMAGEMGAVSSALFDANGFLESMSPLQREIYEYGQKFAQTDLASGVDAAAAAALALAQRLGISLDRAKGMMELGYGAPVQYDPRAADYDPARASAGRAAQLQKDRFGFNYSTTVQGTKFADDKTGGGREAKLRKQIDLTKELTQAEKDRQTILESIESSLEDGFMSMVDGTKSVKSAFKSMAAEIIKELYRVLVVQRLVGGISGAVNMLTLPAGPSTGTLGLPKFATGGSMMPGGSYIVGENGPELVIPRHSGTVVNANQTANAMGGGGGFTQNLSINVSGSDATMVRTEIAKMIPQITNATKAAVIDARLRGGQMKAAFQ